jgi:PKHD-type hydroxylase
MLQAAREFKGAMLLQIAAVLSRAEVAAVRASLSDDSLWREGAETAAGRARAVKNNQQAAAESSTVKGVLEKISRAVLAHKTIVAAAQPAALARLTLSRYRPGMAYGAHVDAPYIDGVRTDVSFTLFLSDPSDYDGGELVIDAAGAEDRIKLPAGDLVLYPATFVHRVSAVTRGERLAAFGWVKSRVRLAEHRAMLFELERALAELAAFEAPADLRDRLGNLRNNLLRAFGE